VEKNPLEYETNTAGKVRRNLSQDKFTKSGIRVSFVFISHLFAVVLGFLYHGDCFAVLSAFF